MFTYLKQEFQKARDNNEKVKNKRLIHIGKKQRKEQTDKRIKRNISSVKYSRAPLPVHKWQERSLLQFGLCNRTLGQITTASWSKSVVFKWWYWDWTIFFQVIVVGHHPPGNGDIIVSHTRRFVDAAVEYSDVIVLHISGHTHRDDYRVVGTSIEPIFKPSYPKTKVQCASWY